MNDKDSIEEFLEKIKAQSEWQRKLASEILKIFDSPGFREAQYSLKRFREDIERLKTDTKQLFEELREDGWFIAPALLDLPVQEINALKGRKSGELGEYFCHLLNRNEYTLLEGMVKNWAPMPEYKNRKSLIDAATAAHKQGNYELSVPALTLLIEGVLKDIIGVAKLNPQNHIRQYFARVLGPRLTSYDNFTQEEQIFTDLLVHELFGGNSEWSRNEIAHNYLPKHATEENSTRLLFLLDKLMRDWGADLS